MTTSAAAAPKKLTDAQAIALRTILASGGLFYAGCGALSHRNGLTYSKRWILKGEKILCISSRVLDTLIAAGLVEARLSGHRVVLGIGTFQTCAFVNAAGCTALYFHS